MQKYDTNMQKKIGIVRVSVQVKRLQQNLSIDRRNTNIINACSSINRLAAHK
jgi:hypothetical protein